MGVIHASILTILYSCLKSSRLVLPEAGSMHIDTLPAQAAAAIVQACYVFQKLLLLAKNTEECHVCIGVRLVHQYV